VELIQRTEKVIGKKMDLWPTDKDEVALLKERVEEACRLAAIELRDQTKSGTGKRKRGIDGKRTSDDKDRDDDVMEAGMPLWRKKGKRV
jgi:ATP-dependent RNA helicase DDX47/RRP3